ncbi:MAG: hypothetical protein HY564_03405, partial [Candidatus Jacksonbacteria bacterium]|nr:hypothetical protein [Candidatus Jacksonbacteria bacterium]
MLKYILQRILLDIAYFPLWWYTRGLLKIIRFGGRSISDIERNLALGIWLKAMFKPMFQDYTWEGRLVSFFMRAVLLIFKTLMFFVWVIGVIILIIAWLALPVV